MKKSWIVVLIVVVIAGVGFFVFRRARVSVSNATPITNANLQTVAIQEGYLQNTISASGQVRSQQTTQLNWLTSGIVETVTVKLGDKVKADDKLATLAQTSLPQAVILAQSNIYNDQQALADLSTTADTNRIQALNDIATYQQNVRDAQYQLDNFSVPTDIANMTPTQAVTVTKQNLDAAYQAFLPYKYYSSGNATRTKLFDTLSSAQSDYDTAIKQLQYLYNLQVAQGNLAQAQANYDKYKNGPDQSEIDAAKAKIASDEAILAEAYLAAPIDGTITQVNSQVGDSVSTGTSAFQLDNLSALYIDVQVSEVDIDQVSIGQPVTVTFDALRGQTFNGKVTNVALVSETTSGAVNFDVTVQLTDSNQGVRPGMTAVVDIVTSQSNQTLLVPNQAVRTINGSQVVYVQQGTNLVSVPVTIGASSGAYSQVLSGNLKAGDMVVLNPPSPSAQTTPSNRPFFFGGGNRQQNNNGGGSSNSSGGGGGGGIIIRNGNNSGGNSNSQQAPAQP